MKITSEQQYRESIQELSRLRRPPRILCRLMNALEAYRAARKHGWSRPWNKHGVMNFQAFRLDPDRDESLLTLAGEIIDGELSEMPESARAFADDLLAQRERLMGFLFVHEVTEEGEKFEGATLSLGRLAADKPRHRDRLDLIVESPVREGESVGFGRIRAFVDPFRGRTGPLWTCVKKGPHQPATERLFERLAEASHAWVGDADREWEHWTSAYVDYFGPRQWSMDRSFFFTPTDAAIVPTSLPLVGIEGGAGGTAPLPSDVALTG